ncbi:MAG: hypothetical protein JWP42_1369, partial [Pseudomonas sp.]|nr:hypothetical protein [Pseudomonas sp.]
GKTLEIGGRERREQMIVAGFG